MCSLNDSADEQKHCARNSYVSTLGSAVELHCNSRYEFMALAAILCSLSSIRLASAARTLVRCN